MFPSWDIAELVMNRFLLSVVIIAVAIVIHGWLRRTRRVNT
jgi:hypothetical protein